MFDREQRVEQLSRAQRRIADRDRVQVEGLILKSRAFGLGFDELGNEKIGEEAGELSKGEVECGATVPEVGTECNRYFHQCLWL